MKNVKLKLCNNSGYSMIEVLLALFLSAIITASVFEVYINQHKNWNIQDDVVDIQQNGRAAMDELTRQIRMAGHQLPLGIDGIEASNTNPDTITINYSGSSCMAPIEHTMPNASAELRCDGHDISCFYDGQMAYIFHPDSGGGEFFEITHVQVAASHIQHNTTVLSQAYDKDAIVISLDRIKFFVDTTDTAHPNLMIQYSGQTPEIYAVNIEDLQFRYRMKNGTIVDTPAIPNDIRAVEIGIVARSDNPDPDFTHDPYRHRSYSSMVNLRNLDI